MSIYFIASLGKVMPSSEPVKSTVSPTDITSKKPAVVDVDVDSAEDVDGRSEYPPLGKFLLDFTFGTM